MRSRRGRPGARNSRTERDPSLSSRHDAPTPDRRLRWRRVLDGGREPALGRLRARAGRGGGPRPAEGLLPPDRVRGRRPLRGPLLPALRGESLRAVARVAVPARLRDRRRARAPARPGPRVRRRRQRHLPDGRAARARARRRAARGVGGRRRHVRAQRRVAVLVRRGDDGLPRLVAAGAGDRADPGVERRALRQGAAPPARLPRRRRRRHARRLRGGGRRGAALRRRVARARRVLAAARRARTGSMRSTARSWSCRSRSTTSARRDAWSPRLPPEPGARRAGRVPTIFAMGGGGFTMEPENPALDDYVRTLAPAREPRICLLPTAGGDSEDQIRRFQAAFGDQLCEPTHVSLFRLGTQPRAAARAPARPGHHLRRRRLDDQPARAVARARARRDPARGVAGRDRARRAERRVDVLVRVGRDEVGRAPHARARPRLPARLELRPLRRRAGAAPVLPRRGRARRRARRLGRRRRRRPPVPRHAARRGRRVAAAARGRTACTRSTASRSRRRSSRGCSRRGRTPTRRRRSRSTRCARCTRRAAASGATERAHDAPQTGAPSARRDRRAGRTIPRGTGKGCRRPAPETTTSGDP